eukprot:1182348-Prorocentrum_minimum.AAC.1
MSSSPFIAITMINLSPVARAAGVGQRGGAGGPEGPEGVHAESARLGQPGAHQTAHNHTRGAGRRR